MRVEVEADIDPDEVISQLSEEDRREWLTSLEEEFGGSALEAIDDQIHRIHVLGLDTEMTVLEVLERMRDRVAA